MFGIRVQGGFTICISCSHTGIISASEVIAVRVCIVSLRSLVMALSKKRKFSGVPDVEEAPYQPKDYKFPKRSFGKNAQATRSFLSEVTAPLPDKHPQRLAPGTTFLHNSSEAKVFHDFTDKEGRKIISARNS